MWKKTEKVQYISKKPECTWNFHIYKINTKKWPPLLLVLKFNEGLGGQTQTFLH